MPECNQETTVVLVRHGETEWNVAGRIQGHSDSPLTERGRQQGRLVAGRLARRNVGVVCSSDAGRAVETAEMIAASHGLPVEAISDFRERSYGDFEGHSFIEIRKEQGEALEAWLSDRQRLAPPGGETQAQMSARVMAALRHVVSGHRSKTVVVSTHGGPIKSVLFAILEVPIACWDRTWVANGSITVLKATAESLRVAVYNDTCHLDEEPKPGNYV